MDTNLPKWFRYRGSRRIRSTIRPKVMMIILTCSLCKKRFRIFPSRVKTAKFCSRACKDKSQVNRPTWNKGLKGVQVAWNRGLGKYSRICKCGNEKPNLYAKKCK